MNINKNIEKKSPQINVKVSRNLPPINALDTWKTPVPDFIEKRTWNLNGILIMGCLLIITGYTLYKKFLLPSQKEFMIQEPLQQTIANEMVQLHLDSHSTPTETSNYNMDQAQAYLKLTPKLTTNIKEETGSINTDIKKQDFSEITSQQIRTWLQQQHIQGVAYKDFESCIVINGRIVHLNETIAPEWNLVWSDIDPVAKKLFFYDANGILYFINY